MHSMSDSRGKLTPLMQQYWEVKDQHPDKILMFRMGDFFEMFHDDAKTAAPILDIALTARNKKSSDDTPMCGMPHFSIATPISKLLAAGYKVAICDQVEDPKLAKGLVKRAVTRILSPGMVFDPETLDQLETNYMCSYDSQSVAFLEATTGEVFYYVVYGPEERQKLFNLLNPVEIVVSSREKSQIMKTQGIEGLCVTVYDVEFHELNQSWSFYSDAPESVQRLVSYAHYMQGEEVLSVLQKLERRTLQSFMELSPTAVQHLELFKSYRGDKKGTLLQTVNKTKSAIGARLLKRWMQFPLMDQSEIEKRQEQVAYWMKDPLRLKEMRTAFSGMGDVERRLSKVLGPQSLVRDLVSLCHSLQAGLAVTPFCSEVESSSVEAVTQVVEKIQSTLVDELPSNEKNGGYIAKGLFAQLDEYIELSEKGQNLLKDLEERERRATGITTLKVKYNNVFGYFLEVTKAQSDKVPSHYVRKQTLTNAERFLTDELKVLEEKLLSADAKRVQLEQRIFQDLKKSVQTVSVDILNLSRKWAELDVLSSFSWLAIERKYRRPEFNSSGVLDLQLSRHPVVEADSIETFVPNSLSLKKGECLLLTGPNMAGKSTLMRQVAVIVILAQMGCFVPVESAQLPIYDQVFTRIGATDFLSEGLSTFMVEMKETAEMLDRATDRSLIVLDEVGRGTSTYDGMSLAQAILEYLIEKVGATSLFATHYHELTQMDYRYPQVKNAHMSIRETGDKMRDLVFLYTLKEGPANKSYGIHVAQLAGLPKKVIRRAEVLLENLESFQSTSSDQLSLLQIPVEDLELKGPESKDSIEVQDHPLVSQIESVTLQSLTPLDALNLIADWQKQLL
ncbi:MAG: DNA mismatch repair protein MutS [Bdellovibrionales bacterium]|nr:DNA mismatch repair protein MutS [Bdellovibrionales bacterium]